ncbi:hypothetical protein RRG08_021435 [Elysia crispata]|uniref:Uncharacterized protein n=1 Tax=Elysia crispata TaxID=231223 RepID=A0AAE1A5S1_9GAST|nr:hypothetical protein RRG08_021435 [Elysia crispata]
MKYEFIPDLDQLVSSQPSDPHLSLVYDHISLGDLIEEAPSFSTISHLGLFDYESSRGEYRRLVYKSFTSKRRERGSVGSTSISNDTLRLPGVL